MNATPHPALELRNLSGGWGGTTVIEDVSMALAPGEIVAIVGRNGVGKSTLLELIVGRAQRHRGEILAHGVNLAAAPIYHRPRQGIVYVPQARELFPSLTVREHLTIAARPGPWDRARVEALFPSLTARSGHLASQLSGGEQQMVAIARALIGNGDILLMDEPSEGLAPVVIDQLLQGLRRVVADGGLSVLIVEQRLDIALELSRRCLVMERGRIAHEEVSATLRAEPARFAQIVGLGQA